MMDHIGNDHTGWVVANLQLGRRFNAYGQVALTDASSSISGLALDAGGLAGIPPGFDYGSVSELQDFSNLSLRWWSLEGGLRHLVARKMLLEYALNYQDYDDRRPYLVDASGSRLGVLVRANWLF